MPSFAEELAGTAILMNPVLAWITAEIIPVSLKKGLYIGSDKTKASVKNNIKNKKEEIKDKKEKMLYPAYRQYSYRQGLPLMSRHAFSLNLKRNLITAYLKVKKKVA